MTQQISLKEIGSQIIGAEHILLLTHYRPDGDAIGSLLALRYVLESLGKKVTAVNRDEIPDYLEFLLKRPTDIVRPEQILKEEIDLVIALDSATPERIGEFFEEYLSLEAKTIAIDHHISNQGYGDFLYLDSKAAATGEILHDLFMAMEVKIPKESRDALYVAISTDTGSLQYSNASAKTYRCISQIVEEGVDVARINSLTYHNHSIRRLHLLQGMIQTADTAFDDQVAFMLISKELQEKCGAQRGDTEGLMDLIRGINTVRVCFTLEEGDNSEIRLSMRSKDEALDVSAVCASFGGGGHRLAAGAQLNGSLSAALNSVLNQLKPIFI